MRSTDAPVKTAAVEDSVPKVNNDLAVGADLHFQRRWWKFEKTVWWLFGLIVLLDVLGCFGRGPVANAELRVADRSMDIRYERLERLGTPSLLTIRFGSPAIHDEYVELMVSESLVQELGTQRVVPQPAMSRIGEGKILYRFAASRTPAAVQLALEPTRAGLAHLTLQVPGFNEAKITIFVFP